MEHSTYRIVVGFDYSEEAVLALRRAFELASREERAEVHVITVLVMAPATVVQGMGEVLPVPMVPLDEAYDALEARVGQHMSEWQSETGKSFSRLSVHVRSEVPALEIAQLATDLEADLVVVGTHGRRGLMRFLLGSVAEGVVRAAHCPVLVVRPVDHTYGPPLAPPCPACLETRAMSRGEVLWREAHRDRHGQRPSYE